MWSMEQSSLARVLSVPPSRSIDCTQSSPWSTFPSPSRTKAPPWTWLPAVSPVAHSLFGMRMPYRGIQTGLGNTQGNQNQRSKSVHQQWETSEEFRPLHRLVSGVTFCQKGFALCMRTNNWCTRVRYFVYLVHVRQIPRYRCRDLLPLRE